MSLTLSLCQYILRPRRGLGQALLEAPRLQALATFHQHNRKGKIVMIKTSRYIRLVMGSFFGTWNGYDFWRRSWGLPCSRPLLRTRCWFVVWRWCVSCSWRRYLGVLKTRPPRRHRIQFVEGPVLDPRAKEMCFKKGSESGPLEIKSGPPWRVQFWPLHCDKSIKTFIPSWSWFHQQQLRLEFWTGEAHFCAPAFCYVLRTKKRGPSLSCCFAQFP